MIRTKGEAGTGNVVEAVRHARSVQSEIRRLQSMDEDEVFVYAKEIQAPYALVLKTKELGRLPVVNFAAGGVATPADAALMMQVCAALWLEPSPASVSYPAIIVYRALTNRSCEPGLLTGGA